MNSNLLFIITIISSASYVPLIKKYNNTKSNIYLILALIIYILAFILYIKIFQKNNISVSYPFIRISAVILVILFGIYVFDEKISKKCIFGIILGLLSIYLLSN